MMMQGLANFKVVHLPQTQRSFTWLHFRTRHFRFYLNVNVLITANPMWKYFRIPNVIVIIDADFSICTSVNFW
jgi:hypothetical protein